MDKQQSALSNGASSEHPPNAYPTPVYDLVTKQTGVPSLARPAAANGSPFSSRRSSPVRSSARSHASTKPATGSSATDSAATPTSALSVSSNGIGAAARTRRNSQQDGNTGPSRQSRTNLSIQNSPRPSHLSSATIPTLPCTTPETAGVRVTSLQKSDNREPSRWPVSPRLRSPPPTPNRSTMSYGNGTLATTPNSSSITNKSVSTEPDHYAHTPGLASSATVHAEIDQEDSAPNSGMRTPTRGVSGNIPTLETVQESSPLASPKALSGALEKLQAGNGIYSETGSAALETVEAVTATVKPDRAKQLASQAMLESGSESGGLGSSIKASRRTSASTGAIVPPPLTSRNSSTLKLAGAGGKGKNGEGSQPTMTVETETVTSIPNVGLGTVVVQGSNGSLRTKPSSETIRPKKEKKKSSRKQTAVTAGTATSKADIFEAKIASAVDEANTSDSEETFVYDSNPADSRDRPHRFHHSRTPSATSITNDRGGMRSIHSVLEGPGPSATIRKSMKFVNTFGNSSGNDSGMGDDEAKRSVGRGVAPGSGRGTARLHHHVGGSGSHIGRWGLSGPKSGHQSLFDNESPFTINNSSRSKQPPSDRLQTGSTSPRASGSISGRGTGPYSKRSSQFSKPLGYDMDETMAGGSGGDERTPLISSTLRGPGRTNRARRHNMSLRSLEQQSYHPPASFLNRFANCLVLTVMLMLVISGAIGFMFATSQPLEDIELVKISGVIASEQELMFDLMVRAHNPNVVVVTVESADMEVFAKSPHAGTDSDWWHVPHGSRPITSADSSDSTDFKGSTISANQGITTGPGNAPRDQPDSAPNFLLGKFTEFDNPLSFEGSFFHHGLSTSRSGVRIRHPGNDTAGGTERWERIIDDEFDLIVKGVLRYSLPLSQRVRSALIEGRTTVKPNEADNPSQHPNRTLFSTQNVP